MEVRAWEVGRGEGRPVMGRIRVAASPGTKVSPRPTGASLRESMENTLNGKSKSEMEVVRPPVGASPPLACPEPGVYHGSIAKVVRLYRVAGFDQGIGL